MAVTCVVEFVLLFCSWHLFALRKESTGSPELFVLSSHLVQALPGLQGPSPKFPWSTESTCLGSPIWDFLGMSTLQCSPGTGGLNPGTTPECWTCSSVVLGLRLPITPGTILETAFLAYRDTPQGFPEVHLCKWELVTHCPAGSTCRTIGDPFQHTWSTAHDHVYLYLLCNTLQSIFFCLMSSFNEVVRLRHVCDLESMRLLMCFIILMCLY